MKCTILKLTGQSGATIYFGRKAVLFPPHPSSMGGGIETDDEDIIRWASQMPKTYQIIPNEMAEEIIIPTLVVSATEAETEENGEKKYGAGRKKKRKDTGE